MSISLSLHSGRIILSALRDTYTKNLTVKPKARCPLLSKQCPRSLIHLRRSSGRALCTKDTTMAIFLHRGLHSPSIYLRWTRSLTQSLFRTSWQVQCTHHTIWAHPPYLGHSDLRRICQGKIFVSAETTLRMGNRYNTERRVKPSRHFHHHSLLPSPSSSFSGDAITPSSSFSFFKRKFRLPGRDSYSDVKKAIASNEENPRRSLSPLSFIFDSRAPESAPCSLITPTASVQSPRQPNSSVSNASNEFCPIPPSIHILRMPVPQTPKFEHLPEKLSWLKGINLEIWIDQEGFRATRAAFRLAGYSELDRSFEPFGQDSTLHPQTNAAISGIADFIPIKRQVFIFHRSALDSPPVLRRLTIHGDESRDYISRQASLTLKNGVYTIRGYETSSLSSLGHGRNSTDLNACSGTDAKLKWKFDYMVKDRRGAKTGKILAGEKTLTPLAFSCSPFLLHSLQGKKVRLLHTVKKSVALKISAEKLEPPKPPNKSPNPTAPVLLPFALKTNLLPVLAPSHPVNQKTRAWTLHRRAYSHAVGQNITPDVLLSSSKCNERQASTKAVGRRRASSAGERNSPDKVSREAGPAVEHIAPYSGLYGDAGGDSALISREQT